jgi:hypothetical protein
MTMALLLLFILLGHLLFAAHRQSLPRTGRFHEHRGARSPDFRTISDFRKRHLEELGDLFKQILQLCEKAGLVKLGHVALDGTKIKANASNHKAMSYERMEKRASWKPRSPCGSARPRRRTPRRTSGRPRSLLGDQARAAAPPLAWHRIAGDGWRSWRGLMIAAIGEEFSEDERKIFTELTGRVRERQRVDEFAAAIGRRGGKSRAMATLATYTASRAY